MPAESRATGEWDRMNKARIALAAAAGWALTGASPPAVTVYGGGPIVTMAGDAPETVEAIAVSDGKIVAVGTSASVNKQAGRRAVHVDLHGRTLLPGFIDAHGHVSQVGQTALGGTRLSGAAQDGVRCAADRLRLR